MSEVLPSAKDVARIPADELYQIQEADLRRAIAAFESGAVSHEFAESSRFDLLVDGRKRYPPKAIIGIAAQESLGRVLVPSHFSGGESSTAFRLLWERGFELVTKPRAVGSLDATFSIGRSRAETFLIVESRGPNRNTDYIAGLESLLHSLADLDATILSAAVDSGRTSGLSAKERQLALSEHRLPVRLRIVDLQSLRLDVTSSAAATGRRAESTGSGNPTKRIRLGLAVPSEIGLWELATTLAQDSAASVGPPRQFRFRPAAPTQSSDEGARKAVDPTVVTRIHMQMQKALYDLLVTQYGGDKVSAEQMTCSGRPADLVVETPAGYEIYEIKTALSPRDCVRQAFGQLLEYAYWPVT